MLSVELSPDTVAMLITIQTYHQTGQQLIEQNNRKGTIRRAECNTLN
jgi:hypothetical protein